jgi:hypothetical protein
MRKKKDPRNTSEIAKPTTEEIVFVLTYGRLEPVDIMEDKCSCYLRGIRLFIILGLRR